MSRHAKAETCPRCRAVVLVGPDDDVAALVAVVDPDPIPAAQEWLALVAGRPTYTLHPRGPVQVLNARTHWGIRANTQPVVYVTHECGNAMPPAECVPADAVAAIDPDAIPF